MKERINRPRDIKAATGLSRWQLARLEAEGKFPGRIRLSTQAVGWLESEVTNWLEQRAHERKRVLGPQAQPQREAAVGR